jgi:hypothetical protein
LRAEQFKLGTTKIGDQTGYFCLLFWFIGRQSTGPSLLLPPGAANPAQSRSSGEVA